MKSNPHQVICEEIYVVISCMTVPFCMCTDNTYIVSKELCWSLRMSTFRFVDVSTCRRFGLSTFWFVDVSACRRFGLSTFWFVDVSVCRRFGLSTFRFVDVSVCRRFGCRRFGLSTFWLVTTEATLEHRLPALLQLHRHSRLNAWLQYNAQRKTTARRDETFTFWGLVRPILEIWRCISHRVHRWWTCWHLKYYSDVPWASQCFKPLFSSLFMLTTKNKTPKLRMTGVLWGESTDDRWIPSIPLGTDTESVSMSRRRYDILTHRGRDKMAAISQTTFSNAFSWMKNYEFRLRFTEVNF